MPTHQSDRRSLHRASSIFGGNIVNQFRYAQLGGWLGGSSNFDLVGGTEFFDNLQRGYSLTLGAGLTNPTIRNAFSSRASPTEDFTNNLTWIKGNHTITVGGQLKRIRTISDSVGQVAQTVTFGVPTTDTAVLNAFSATSLPARTPRKSPRSGLYATLTGRVSASGQTRSGPTDNTLLTSPEFELRKTTTDFSADAWRIVIMGRLITRALAAHARRRRTPRSTLLQDRRWL